MAGVGVTKEGFVIKGLGAILAEKAERARAMFGPDVDLRSTSSLRKLLEIASAADHELWKELERRHYGTFMSTASGDSLDLLGEDVGLSRRLLNASGEVKLKLAGAAPGRSYHLPLGTLLETDPPARFFRTLALVTLSADQPEQTVAVQALARGPAANVAAGAIKRVNPEFAARHLNLGPATFDVKNEAPTTGGDRQEDDESYRSLLLGFPRAVWTLESVRRAVRSVDGVRDCRVFDPQGGVDVSQSRFRFFRFEQRRFGVQRLFGAPYFFDLLVAVTPGFPWESQPGVTGVRDAITNAIADLRPVSIFPNIRRANNVQAGVRAKIFVKSGHDRNGVVASFKDRLARRINAQGLGNAVLFAEIQSDCLAVPGVVDVQALHLRRHAPRFVGVSFGRRPRFQSETVELAIGENLELAVDEIAVFEVESELLQIEATDR